MGDPLLFNCRFYTWSNDVTPRAKCIRTKPMRVSSVVYRHGAYQIFYGDTALQTNAFILTPRKHLLGFRETDKYGIIVMTRVKRKANGMNRITYAN